MNIDFDILVIHIYLQGSKSSANWLISAVLELIFMVSEISVNPLKNNGGGGGGSGRAKKLCG